MQTRRMRDREKTRYRILRAGFSETYERGFQPTSVDDIVARAGVTKGAFFHYFPTKIDLGYALADEILLGMMHDRWIAPLSAYSNPVEGMIVLYRKNMVDASDEDLAYGCPLNNLTQEMSAVDPIFREKLRTVLAVWIDETGGYLVKAQVDGYLKPEVDVKTVAQFVVMLEEGSGAMMKNMRDRKVCRALYAGFRQFMESISTRP